jgi:hypothetical protein
VLQYGFYRHATDADKPDLADIHLLILDTRKYPRGTFIQDLQAIKWFQGYSPELGELASLRLSEQYFGEFLSQGYLGVREQCSQTSMQKLIDAGLLGLLPHFMNDRKRLSGPVLATREWIDEGMTREATSDEVRTAITVAQGCFGSRWALPVAVMLLALKPRDFDPTILVGFRCMFSGKLPNRTSADRYRALR